MAGVDSLGKLTLDMVAKTGGFTGPIDKAARHSKTKSKEIESSWKNVGMVVGVAAASAATAIGVMVKQSINAADNARKMAQSVGVTTEALTGLQWAASQSGVSNEQLGTALTRLTVTMGDAARGGKTQKEVFQSLGISIRDTNGKIKDADKVLVEVADKFEKAADGVGKTDAAVKLFGRSGAALIPLLNSGSKGIKELTDQARALGLVISDEQARQSEQFNDSLATLGAVARGTANQIAREMLPALNEMTGLLIELATDSETAKVAAEILGGTMKVLATGVILTVGALERLVSILKAVKGAGLSSMADLEWDETLGEFVPSEAKLSEAKGVWSGFMEDQAGITEKTIDRINKLWSGGYSGAAEGANKVRKALSVAGDENGKLSDSASKADDAIRKQIEALQFQADTLGKTADQITLMKLKNEGATPAQLAQADAILQTVAAYNELDAAAKSFIEQQKEINKHARAIADDMMSDAEKVNAVYEKRRQIILQNTEITGEAQRELLAKLEQKQSDELLEINGTYWQKYLKAAEKSMTNFERLTGDVLENLTSQFGDFFETAIFDSEDLGDSVAKAAEGMARSVINAIGEMIAQWLVYKAVTAGLSMFGGGAGGGAGGGTGTVPGYGARPMGTVAGMHSGGIVGADASFARSVPMSLFSGAARYHNGGLIGDEVPIIAKKGEAVLTGDTYSKLTSTLESLARDRQQNSLAVNVPVSVSAGNNALASELRSEIESSVERVVRRYL